MIKGIGTDIVEIARIVSILHRQNDRFVSRILTDNEQRKYSDSQRETTFLAKRFAAKEAVAKALGTGIGNGVSFQDIEITHDDRGAPLVVLSGGAQAVMLDKGASNVFVSISDETNYAIAYAVITA
ncbi:MAG: holo-ACP synthase [Porticoccaceae bacterium]|nr:holo-ACP synthase [Porticoccaceae bacterium]MDG1473715.1 holo-ACP synthase [Porticoccaceae bacterium]